MRWLSDLIGTKLAFAASFLKLTPQLAPSSPAEGWVYPDATTKRLTAHDGSKWQTYATRTDITAGMGAPYNNGDSAFAGPVLDFEFDIAAHGVFQLATASYTGANPTSSVDVEISNPHEGQLLFLAFGNSGAKTIVVNTPDGGSNSLSLDDVLFDVCLHSNGFFIPVSSAVVSGYTPP